MCRRSRDGHHALSAAGARRILVSVTIWSSASLSGRDDAIVGYRTFVAVVVAAYVSVIVLTPRDSMMMPSRIDWMQMVPLSTLYLVLGIWGFDYARQRSSVPISLAYLL